jgi:Tol biopolymer transport system component
VYVVSASGGPSRELQPDFADARYPAWAPDGNHIIFEGRPDVPGMGEELSDWWVSDLNNGAPSKTGASAFLRREGLIPYACSFFWSSYGLIFSARKAYGTNLWKINVSTRSWKATDSLQQLTSGTDDDITPWVAQDGRLVFAGLNASVSLWSLPEDESNATTRDTLRRITSVSAAVDFVPSLSNDGKTIVFFRRSGEARGIWFRKVDADQEALLTSSGQAVPVISRDGKRVAFSSVKNGKLSLMTMSLAGGPAEQVCDDCGDLLDWSASNRHLLYTARGGIESLDLVSHRKIILLKPRNGTIDHASVSPDDKWIVFAHTADADHSRVAITRSRLDTSADEPNWIYLTDGMTRDVRPTWSGDGNAVFMVSNRDGFNCVWKVQVDPITKVPKGDPTSVHHLHSPGSSLEYLTNWELRLSVGGHRIALDVAEVSSNVFTAQLSNH